MTVVVGIVLAWFGISLLAAGVIATLARAERSVCGSHPPNCLFACTHRAEHVCVRGARHEGRHECGCGWLW